MNVIIGGSGFLGMALVAALRERGEAVRVVDLTPHPDPAVESVIADIRDAASISAALAGATTVFHTASFIYYGLERPQHVFDINVTGTENVIAACKANEAHKLVYTSSAEAMLSRDTPIENGDESLPYPLRFASLYGETKAAAEQRVLAANGQGGLLTCSLRPNGIYGAQDKHQLEAIMNYIRRKRFIRIGDGRARCMQIYVDNAVHAHLLAAECLTPDSPAGGQAYFIADGDAPRNHFDFFADILAALEVPLPTQQIPLWLARLIARSSEAAWKILPKGQMAEPSLNQHTIAATSQNHWFRLDKVRRDLGYEPIVPYAEGVQRTAAAMRERFADEFAALSL